MLVELKVSSTTLNLDNILEKIKNLREPTNAYVTLLYLVFSKQLSFSFEARQAGSGIITTFKAPHVHVLFFAQLQKHGMVISHLRYLGIFAFDPGPKFPIYKGSRAL